MDPADVVHLGPVAQDFHAAFGLGGNDDRHIAPLDPGGIALAAIQGLYQELQQRDAAIAALQAEVAALRAGGAVGVAGP